jgi:hypothetical protein
MTWARPGDLRPAMPFDTRADDDMTVTLTVPPL